MNRKARLLLAAALLLLLSFPASAEESLYPIRENGKWGYMNRQGEAVIPAQWEYAEAFQNGVAIVSNSDDEHLPQDDLCGLIDCQGRYILEPFYQAYGNYRFADPDHDGLMAYYDPASGYLSPFQYQHLFWGWSGELLIYVPENENRSFDSPYGFLKPSTGEAVTPAVFDGLYDDVGCSEGYIMAAFEMGRQTDGEIWGPDYHLYTLDGREIRFPEGISPCGGVCGGVLVVQRRMTDEEYAAKQSGWGTAYGLAKADGTILLPPIYDYISNPYPGGCGRVSFWDNGLNGILDLEGRVIVPPRYRIETGGEIPEIYYRNGYALITDEVTERNILLDADGNERYAVPIWEGNTRRELYGVFGNGCFWESVWADEKKYALMKIENGVVTRVTAPVFEAVGDFLSDLFIEYDDEDDFSEGLYPVKLNGQFGYINERGEMAIQPAWDQAARFHNGLAMVMKQNRLFYIDHEGKIVWEEKESGVIHK